MRLISLPSEWQIIFQIAKNELGVQVETMPKNLLHPFFFFFFFFDFFLFNFVYYAEIKSHLFNVKIPQRFSMVNLQMANIYNVSSLIVDYLNEQKK